MSRRIKSGFSDRREHRRSDNMLTLGLLFLFKAIPLSVSLARRWACDKPVDAELSPAARRSKRLSKLALWLMLALSPVGLPLITLLLHALGVCTGMALSPGGGHCHLFSAGQHPLDAYLEFVDTYFWLSMFAFIPVLWLPVAFCIWLTMALRLIFLIRHPDKPVLPAAKEVA